MDGKRYGTFEKSIADAVMECIDQKIMIKFHYTIRYEADKEFNDITNFSKAIAGKDYQV